MLCIPIILTVVFAKKLYDFIFPFELEKVYLTLGLYAVKTYTYSYLIYKKIMDFFTINNNNILITFIKDGNEEKECTLSQLKYHLDSIHNYDLILYKEPHVSSDKYKYNIVRLNENIDNMIAYTISNIRFIDAQIIYKNNKYNVDFSKNNYYINDNILFDKAFVKWYLNHAYGLIIEDTEDYTYTILDENINFISLEADNTIVIENDGYRVVSSNIDTLSYEKND